MKRIFALLILLLIPTFVFGAGFAKQSLFLSKSPVTEGDHVRIYSIVANETNAKFTGTVVFKDGDTKITATAVSIDAGGTQTVSAPWTAVAGDHKISAELSTSGTVVEQESAVFSIAAKPQPVVITPPTATGSAGTLASGPNSSSSTIETSQGIQNQIGSFSPTAESWAAPIFGAIDSFRATAARLIDSQLTNAKQNLAKTSKPGVVAGSATETPKTPDAMGGFWFVLWTIYLYILTLLQFLISNAAVFYPVFMILIFYFLWRMFRRYKRPSY